MKMLLYLIITAIAIISNIALGIKQKRMPISSMLNSAAILTLLGFYYFM